MNNLHIDLILDSERRSASPVSLKLIGRLAILVVVLSIILAGSLFAMRMHGVKSELADLNAQWDTIQPKQKRAQKEKKQLRQYETMLKEINSWNKGRIPWDEWLLDIQRTVPAEIQLITMKTTDALVVGQNAIMWKTNMDMSGRAKGKSPKRDVDNFVKSLRGLKAIRSASVKPQSFRPDNSAGSKSHHRIFQIEITFNAKEFTYETPKG